MKLGTGKRQSILWKGLGVIVSSLMILALLPMSPAAAAATDVTAGAEYSYTEQQGVIPVGAGITIANGTSYAGEYIDFEVTGADTHDILTLDKDATPSTASGVVSIVGDSVYLGNGTIAEPVGSVDPTLDGQAGRKLRVNFTTQFTNPGFEDGGTLGWTPLQQQINLGVTNIAGFVANDTSTYPPGAPNQDNNVPSSATYSVASDTSGGATEGTHALRLQSNMTTAQGCDVVHGPAVYSGEFEAAANDKIYFDWRAFSGSDAYAVFGYIVDRNGNQTEVLDTYATSSSNTNWVTKETVIPAGGHYRFVFVAGTSDASCGQAAGASLYIDNVRVFGSKASDEVVQQVARRLQYENTSDNPAAQRTITVTANSNSNGSDSDTLTVNITGVDDPFDATSPAAMVFTNTIANGETFTPQGGQISVTDPDTTSFNFALAGSTTVTATIAGNTYDQALTNDYGTMYVDSATGRYVFDPNSTAIDGRMTDDSSQVTVTVTSGAFSDTVTLTMRVDVPDGVAAAPTNLSATPGDTAVGLSWDAPVWTGGQDITGYRVQYSSDGGDTWATVSPNVAAGATTATVTGLDNGTNYTFRVQTLNGSGASSPSDSASATPLTVPGAPGITGVTEADGELTVTFSAPDSNGGAAITAYKISLDGGETWSPAGTTPGSITMDGLENGTAYQILVAAVNAAGTGTESVPATGTPRTTPDAPSISGITEKDQAIEIGITAPDFDGGSAITGYEVSLDGGETFPYSFGPDVESALIPELANGTTYDIVVRAVNEAGSGGLSDSKSATPRTVPGVPTITKIVAGNRSLKVSLAAPADNGGASVTSYELSLDNGVTWTKSFPASTNPIEIYGLENATTYPIKVRAVNEAGAGDASTAVPGTPVKAPVVSGPSNGDGTGSGGGTGGSPSLEVPPGTGVLVVNGEETTVTPRPNSDGNAIGLSGDGWKAAIGGLAADGDPMDLDAQGRLIVYENGSVRVTGSGFAPNSTVDVWLFSTPTFLGDVTVRVDGTFDEVLALPAGIALGQHTVQMNGLGVSGEVYSVSTGLIVNATPTSPATTPKPKEAKLAFTGAESLATLPWALTAVLVGTVMVVVRRRYNLEPVAKILSDDGLR